MTNRCDILFVSSSVPPGPDGTAAACDRISRLAAGRIRPLGIDVRGAGPWNTAAAAWRITGAVLRYGIRTVCIGAGTRTGWMVFPLRYLMRRRVVLLADGEAVAMPQSALPARPGGAHLRHAHAVIAASEFRRSEIVAHFGIAGNRVHVVSHGVDTAVFSPGPAERDQPTILSNGRLDAGNGHEFLIRAMPAILQDVPEALCLIAGTGPLADRLQTTAAQLGVSGRVAFLGDVPQDRLVQLHRAADVFVLPCHPLSDADAGQSGLAFLQANACGTPVVAGAAGGTVEAVIDGVTGTLVDGTDPAQIAAATIAILADRARRDAMAQAGWRRAQAYSWEATTARFLAVCDAAAPPPRGLSYRTPAPVQPAAGAAPAPRLLVTVDVEEEFDWAAFSRTEHRVRGLEHLRLFHRDCVETGIQPIYLVNYCIMNDAPHAEFLREVQMRGEASLGTHLHAWTTPPDWEQPNAYSSYQCNLPAHVERRKLGVLHDRFQDVFGFIPRIHRAGRWGGGDRTAALLAEMGTRIDLSPSAFHGMTDPAGPNFENLDGAPFWSAPDRQVITIPASGSRYLRGPNRLSRLARNWVPAGLGRALFRNFGQSVRFSPETADASLLDSVAQDLIDARLPLAVYTLHNTSLYPGGNPYSTTAEDAAALRRRSREFLAGLVRSGRMVPASADDIEALYFAPPATAE